MIVPALLCALGLPAGFLLIRRIPTCPPAETCAAISFSIIIPARNEEQNLPRLLGSIAHSARRPAEVLVVDDGSTDNSAAVATRLGARVMTSAAKPAGWTGKSWACYQGAQSATGELLLFLDADTYFLPGGLDRVLSRWLRERDRRLVLSLLPYHGMNAPYEQLSLFFNVLMAAGAGGFGALAAPRLFGQSLLISKDAYFAAGGHAAVRGVVLENLRWASKLRDCGARILCLGGQGTLHMRMFPEGFRQMSDSWTKAFLQGAGGFRRHGSCLCRRVDLRPLVHYATADHAARLWPSRPRAHLLSVLACRSHGWLAGLAAIAFSPVCSFRCHSLTTASYFGRAGARRVLGRKTVWRGREV